jgi:hypothetical protein
MEPQKLVTKRCGLIFAAVLILAVISFLLFRGQSEIVQIAKVEIISFMESNCAASIKINGEAIVTFERNGLALVSWKNDSEISGLTVAVPLTRLYPEWGEPYVYGDVGYIPPNCSTGR